MKCKAIFFSFFFRFLFVGSDLSAQLKFLIDDFEGYADGFSETDSRQNGLFTYGNAKSVIIHQTKISKSYIGQRYLQIKKGTGVSFGGWGKGIGANVELFQEVDYLNFYCQSTDIETSVKVQLQEDDNGDGIYEKGTDDLWTFTIKLQSAEENPYWQLNSIPLSEFKDDNAGGDGIFNINYKQGKLICLLFIFGNNEKENDDKNSSCSFDFLCFSKGKLPTELSSIVPSVASSNDYCSLGIWSKEGITADFIDIANAFEKNFKSSSDKKLAVVHFFHPLAVDGSTSMNNFPEVAGINKIIKRGYIPMITLEDHFVNVRPRIKQPNLYSIVEGHFDPFLKQWAKEIKKVNGVVLLRILHEFNGDWYPWCISKNNNDPALLIKAFRHIHSIFKEQNATNVKFIWCPNSTSFPQESWNFIMDAYPGDEYVDFVGLDIYNGAGQEMPVWRSFRKEGIENYFILRDKLPHKPLFVCETASRERKKNEPSNAQGKAEWIDQMCDAIKTDMSEIRLLSWFNEKEPFRINSTPESKEAYLNYILKDSHFKSGTEAFEMLLK